MTDWATLARNLGVDFEDVSLLEQAMVHRSYLNENPDFILPSNERLEFLGDAVLGLAVAEYLYLQDGELNEGEMTKIRAAVVSTHNLARVASFLGLGDHLYLGQGEERGGGRKRSRNLACLMEAVVGAVFLDGGFLCARDFVWKLLGKQVQDIIKAGVVADYKTRLQEVAQGRQQGIPIYRVVSMAGPNHDRRFTVEVMVGGEVVGSGSGTSKQLAEKQAAREALEYIDVSFSGSG